MNKRQKKKQLKIRNKKLIKHYPFLLPKNVWSGRVVKGYDYTWTEYDCLCKGWRIGFGKFLLQDLREACLITDFLDKLQFSQIKEKYGSLRMYNFGAPQEVHNVLNEYEFISQYVCCQCGSPYACIVDNYGWYLPLCEKCWNKNNKLRESKGWKVIPWEEVYDEENFGLPNEYKVRTYSKGKDEIITFDISKTVNKIKRKYEKTLNSIQNNKGV